MIEEVTPRVILLAHTDNLMIPAKAARFCTSSKTIEEIMDDCSYDDRVLDRVLEAGHNSILEHISFTFGISGVSRVTETQFVRHRVASYSVKSGRYTKVGEHFKVVLPKSLKGKFVKTSRQLRVDNPLSANELMRMCHDFYLGMLEQGVAPEDARFILPQATATQFLVTMNARELLHFFGLRCCGHAQWEIREVAGMMLRICKDLQPVIFGSAGPRCVADGYCRESKLNCCGYRPHISNQLNI